MAKVSQVYASPWLKAEDLAGKTVKVKIARAGAEVIKQADGLDKECIIVEFYGKQKRLILNKTQANALALIAGDDTQDWAGTQLYLSPQPTNNGKLTLALMPVPDETTTEGDGF